MSALKKPLGKRALRVQADILEALGDGTMTAWEIHLKSGWSHPTVHRHLHLMLEQNKVRIPSWVNCVVMRWKAGAGRSAPRPGKANRLETQKAWRDRNRDKLQAYQLQANEKQKVIRAAKRNAREHSALAGMWGALVVPGMNNTQ